MKEYCIYIQYGTACPYRMLPYTSFEKAKQALMIIISDYDYKRKLYYVDNDFFDNKYPPYLNGSIYYQIQEREVGDWISFDNKDIINPKKNNCKIINFKKFIDKY